MQRWTSLTVLLLVLLVWSQGVSRAQDTSKNDGHTLLRLCTSALRVFDSGHGDMHTWLESSWCQGYIVGFADGYTMATGEAARGAAGLCPPEEWLSAEQLVRILVEWLRARPSMLHMGMHSLMVSAFADTFPCPPAPALPQEPASSGVQKPSTPTAGKGKRR